MIFPLIEELTLKIIVFLSESYTTSPSLPEKPTVEFGETDVQHEPYPIEVPIPIFTVLFLEPVPLIEKLILLLII